MCYMDTWFILFLRFPPIIHGKKISMCKHVCVCSCIRMTMSSKQNAEMELCCRMFQQKLFLK